MPQGNRRALCSAFIAILLIAPAALAANPAAQTPKPILVVWAHTDLANQGAPTLDLLDLERYFVKRLTDGGVENTVPSATTQIPNPTEPNWFLLELSVDALQPGYRAIRDRETTAIRDDPVFHVELSLAAKRLASGILLRKIGERLEYHLTPYELTQVPPKRVAIYEAADNLAKQFISAAQDGQFGELQKSVPPPTGLIILGCIILIGASIVVISLVTSAIRWLFTDSRTSPATQDLPQPPREPKPQNPRRREDFDKEIEHARVMQLKTDNFSEEWLHQYVRMEQKQILDRSPDTEHHEAWRLLNLPSLEAHYAELAAYAAEHNLNFPDLIEALRRTAELPYRQLQHAKNLYEEIRR